MDADKTYIQFPLFLLRDLFTDKEDTLYKIFMFGAYNFSTSISYNDEAVIKQVVYGIYRGKLTKYLKKYTSNLIQEGKVILDEDYNGFQANSFNPETEILDLTPIYNQDINFRIKAREYYQLHQTFEIFNCNHLDYDICFDMAKGILKQMPDKEPMPMVKTSLVCRFHFNETKDFELMQFAVFIAIGSIIGKKSFTHTNYEMIFARAFGYNNHSQVPDEVRKTNLFVKYTKRHHREKMLNQLELNWNIIKYSYNGLHGFYVGKAKKTNYRVIAEYDMKNKKSNKIKKLQEDKKNAYMKAKNNSDE